MLKTFVAGIFVLIVARFGPLHLNLLSMIQHQAEKSVSVDDVSVLTAQAAATQGADSECAGWKIEDGYRSCRASGSNGVAEVYGQCVSDDQCEGISYLNNNGQICSIATGDCGQSSDFAAGVGTSYINTTPGTEDANAGSNSIYPTAPDYDSGVQASPPQLDTGSGTMMPNTTPGTEDANAGSNSIYPTAPDYDSGVQASPPQLDTGSGTMMPNTTPGTEDANAGSNSIYPTSLNGNTNSTLDNVTSLSPAGLDNNTSVDENSGLGRPNTYSGPAGNSFSLVNSASDLNPAPQSVPQNSDIGSSWLSPIVNEASATWSYLRSLFP